METSLIITILGVHLLAVIGPGPDFFVILKTSLQKSTAEALSVSFGIGAGILVHVLYAVLGLAVIISQSIVLFSIIKVLASLYLAFLAYKSFTAPKTTLIETKTTTLSSKKTSFSFFRAFWLGFITNVLNPKATLFFLGVFTAFISPETPIMPQIMVGLIMALNTFLWFGFVSVIFTRKHFQKLFLRFETTINKTFGVILGFLSLSMLKSTAE